MKYVAWEWCRWEKGESGVMEGVSEVVWAKGGGKILRATGNNIEFNYLNYFLNPCNISRTNFARTFELIILKLNFESYECLRFIQDIRAVVYM